MTESEPRRITGTCAISLPVGVHVGSVVGYRHSCDDELLVEVRLWNGEPLELGFRGVVFVQDFQSLGPPDREGQLQEFVEVQGSDLLKNVRERLVWQGTPQRGPTGAQESYLSRLRHFRLSADGLEQSLDIVSESISITRIDESGVRHHVPWD
jgi:hypothetical protein